MNPSQSKRTKLKSTTTQSLKEKGRGQSSQDSLIKIPRTRSSSVPPSSKRPCSASSSVPPQVPRSWDNLQKSKYDLFQGTKYSSGRQILWDVFAHANFYTEVKNFIENIGWMGLADLSKKCYNPLLVNEFYSGLLIHASEYDNAIRFDSEVLYTFIDG